MFKRILSICAIPGRFHMFSSMLIVLAVSFIIGSQVSRRQSFANGELYQDVIDRWGAPIDQPVPSALYVDSGSVFRDLQRLPFSQQRIRVTTHMNYRKRGLVYFSGFDFVFDGAYRLTNTNAQPIDVAFVFPISAERNRVLLKDLSFSVDGQAQSVALDEADSKIVWTGRLQPAQEVLLNMSYSGRGLDHFSYQLDPALPVRDFDLQVQIHGGDNIDYPYGVAPATKVVQSEDVTTLQWSYASLESGIPVGVTLPSEKSFDDIITQMLTRSWATSLLFFAGVAGLCLLYQRRLIFYEAYLVAAGYSLFFVLLAYFAAFMHFYLAYAIVVVIIGALMVFYLTRLLGKRAALLALGLCFSFLFVPTLAVILRGYTGLIYTLEILFGLVALMLISSRPTFAQLVQGLLPPVKANEEQTDAA